MTSSPFNLVDEPWIAVRLIDGGSETISLRDLFHRAGEIRRIAGELPTQDFAVLRIALAVMYRALDDDETLDVIWKSGSLPLREVDGYLDKWRHRFDLFDDASPFMQVAGLTSVSGETRSLTTLVPDCPGAGSLYTMRRDVPFLSFAEAARWLVHCQAYDFDGIKTGVADDPRTKIGKGYPVGIGWTGWLGGLYLEGASLFQTLLHNWVPDPDHRPRDLPLWELEPLTAEPRPSSQIGPFGPAGLFTWPIRHIRLFRDAHSVTRVLIGIGDPLEKAQQLGNEPMTSWRFSDPQTKKAKSPTPLYMPRAHDPTRAIWRGLSAMLPPPEPKKNPKGIVEGFPSTIVRRLGSRLLEGDVSNAQVSVVSVGIEYGANMSTYSEIFSDRLVIRPAIAQGGGPENVRVLEAVRRADQAVSTLAHLASDLARADGGEASAAAAAARSVAYAALDHRFRAWVSQVGGGRNLEDLSQEWFDAAREILTRLGDELLNSATPRSRAIRIVDGHPLSAGSATNRFLYNLNQHLPAASKEATK
ncbi:MAG: type I-E CRISPR-associated protein Cse1/CasA [Gordonia sp. (in: high G+C Gram-positive bacteria)]